MANQTCKITKEDIKKINALYKAFKVKDLKNDNLLALYKTKKLTISIFKNGTLLLQGDEKAIYAFSHKSTSKTTNKIVDGTIGMDEVGTGDYFGPIVTCSCYVADSVVNKVKALRVTDSKKLTDTSIRVMAAKLKKIVKSETCVCQPSIYNKIINQFDNTNIVKAICHNDALSKLTNKLKGVNHKIYLDQFVSRENYYKYLKQAKVKPIYIDTIETKAESKYLAVAAASIIARDAFLNCMDKLSAKAGISLPKGSVEKAKIIAAGKKIIKKYKLEDFAKLNFKPITNEIKK